MSPTDEGSRITHRWEQEPELEDTPGWYQGPAIAFPRLHDVRYDLPPFNALSGVETWLPGPRPRAERGRLPRG